MASLTCSLQWRGQNLHYGVFWWNKARLCGILALAINLLAKFYILAPSEWFWRIPRFFVWALAYDELVRSARSCCLRYLESLGYVLKLYMSRILCFRTQNLRLRQLALSWTHETFVVWLGPAMTTQGSPGDADVRPTLFVQREQCHRNYGLRVRGTLN